MLFLCIFQSWFLFYKFINIRQKLAFNIISCIFVSWAAIKKFFHHSFKRIILVILEYSMEVCNKISFLMTIRFNLFFCPWNTLSLPKLIWFWLFEKRIPILTVLFENCCLLAYKIIWVSFESFKFFISPFKFLSPSVLFWKAFWRGGNAPL